MSNKEDFEAIVQYIKGYTPKQASAVTIRTAFLQWEPTVSRILTVNDEELSKAKDYRDRMNKADLQPVLQKGQTLTPEEENYFVNEIPVVNTSGLSKEEADKKIATAVAKGKPPPASSAWLNVGKTTTVAGKTRKTLRKGMVDGKGSTDIRDWQNVLGINADGKFGTQVEAATKTWQASHGLKADGIVGPQTWTMAAGSSNSATDTVNAVAAATGQTTVRPAVAAASPAKKSTVAAVTTGAVTGKQATSFQEALKGISEKTKTVEAGILSIPKKMPTWGKAGIVAVILSMLGYAWSKRKKG